MSSSGMPKQNDEPTPTDSLWFDAWRGVLYASARVLHVVEPDLIAKAGIPLPWLDVLSQLFDAPDGRLRIQELQARALFTRSGMTRLVDRVEQAGLVQREPVPGDRRGVQVVLTPAGRKRLHEGFAAHLPIIEREFGQRLTVEQQRAVADALAGFWHDDPAEPEA